MKLNIKIKIIITFIIILLIGLSSTGVIVWKLAEKEIVKSESLSGVEKIDALSVSLTSTYEESMSKTNLLAKSFKSNVVDQLVFNEQTVTFNGRSVPNVTFKGESIIGENTPSNEFLKLFNAESTVFLRTGDDFLRVSTSLKKQSGESAFGTILDRNSPAYKAIMAKQEYQGYADLFGKRYLTQYTPIVVDGELLGISFIGNEIYQAYSNLIKVVDKTTWGETGYSFLVSKNGKVIHHSAMKEGDDVKVDLKDGSNYYYDQTDKGDEVVFTSHIDGWDMYLVGSVPLKELTGVVDLIKESLFMVSIVVLFIGSVLLGLFINRSFKPLYALDAFMSDLAQGEGDLTFRMTTGSKNEVDSIAVKLNLFLEKLQVMMQDVKGSSTKLSSDTNLLRQQSISTNENVSKHLAEMELAVTAIEEMGATASSVADSANSAAEHTRAASEVANSSKAAMDEASVSLSELVSYIEQTSIQMTEMTSNTKKISGVLAVIGEIADQTNLLALNAAIEAARAGEHGRGFAVVADEVRSLAMRTQESTSEISKTLEKLNSGAAAVSESMEFTTKSCNLAQEKSVVVQCNIDDMNSMVSSINDFNAQIASAALQQTTVVDEINRNMAALQEVVSVISNESQKTTDISAEIDVTNSNLDSIVSRFKLS